MNQSEIHIASYVQYSDSGVVRDGRQLLDLNDDESLAERMRDGYRKTKMQYPKFHKMDPLCKLAVLTAEWLVGSGVLSADPEKTGVLLFNRHSSIDSDVQHQKAISDVGDGLASPAVFVYTLPNVMIGEICIRQGFRGENACFVVPQFDAEVAVQQAELMFASDMDAVLLGWVDTFADSASAWMVWLKRAGNAPNISQLSSTFLSEIDNSPKWTN